MRLQSFPGERAQIAGQFVDLCSRRRDCPAEAGGRQRPRASGPVVAASDVVIEQNEITNGHTADCLVIGSPTRKVTGS